MYKKKRTSQTSAAEGGIVWSDGCVNAAASLFVETAAAAKKVGAVKAAFLETAHGFDRAAIVQRIAEKLSDNPADAGDPVWLAARQLFGWPTLLKFPARGTHEHRPQTRPRICRTAPN